MRRIAVLDAPSNLGLRPPTATSVPGCAKAPGALRDHGLLGRLGARDAGCLTPPRYDPGDWRPGDGVAQADQIAAYSRALADRIGAILDAGEFPVILGGDCSILLGSGLAMHRLGEAVGGRIGLVFVDGHSDFRHPGNSSYVGAAAGEDLALVTGRGQPDLASIEGRRPYFRDIDVVVLGIRAQDEYRLDLQAAGIVTRPVPALRAEGAARSAQWARDQLVDCAGYWLHVDVDVLDPAVMPAVDAPSPGGIAFPELELLLAGLVESPHCLGVEITVYDPDYDPDGSYAAEITSSVAAGLAAARTVTPRPDLIAARADLANGSRLRHVTPEPPTQPHAEPDVESEAGPLDGPAAESIALGETPTADLSPLAGDDPVEAPAADLPAPPPWAGDESVEAPAADLPAMPPWAGDESVEAPAAGLPAMPPWIGDGAGETPAAGLPAMPPWIGDGAGETPQVDDVSDEPWPIDEPADDVSVDDEDAPAGLMTDEAAVDEPLMDDEPTIDEPTMDEPLADDEPLANDEPLADEPLADGEPVADDEPSVDHDRPRDVAEPLRLLSRPLGQAPLLDSEPLPATRPGMLRPRPADDGFSLPTQRPAFDLGSGSPADLT